MQRFLAILLIIAGLGGIGYGIATATVLRESDTVVATATPSGDGTLVVTEPGVLGLVDDQVTVRATVPEGQKVTLALGSEVDVLGWVGDDPYDSVTGLSTWETLSVAPGTPPEAEQTGEESGEQPGEESADAGKPAKGPDPSGSDMWLSEVSGETTVSMRWTEEPGRVVLLAAGVGDGAEAPTLELTWPRPASTPYLWPGVLGGGFALILGVFMAIGARRGKKKATTRTSSTVRTRRTESELPRRDVFGVDGDQTEAQADGPGFPPAQPGPPAGPGSRPAGGAFPPAGEPAESGTAVFLPAARLRPGRGTPEPVAPEPEPASAWGPPAPFGGAGGAAPITPPPTPEPAPEPAAAPAASVRGLRRSRRAQQGPVAAPAGPAPYGGAPEQAPAAPAAQPAPAAQAAAAPSGRPMTRREMRLREQAQRRAATGAMPAVPASAPEPEPEPEEQQTPSSRAAAWRQTWGVTGSDDGGNR
ncbi:hypothetical protein ACFQHV_09455 [Promicromonospora thailandica]|uniref:hypothetical protein n=1 Tax=Promicromonospora thailandica TaxID=765201 RepID=UPI0020A4DC84|nr:hypothetical protein [Promicromonospora thailandica]